jgi:hypothetical protein
MSFEISFINSFTLALIKASRENTFVLIKRDIINSDLIPFVNEEIAKPAMLSEKTFSFEPAKNPVHYDIPELKPKEANQVQLMQPKPILKQHILPPKMQQRPVQRTMPAPENYQITSGEYGKITALIDDPTVTIIECSGPGQNLSITHAGQKQFTKISLTQEEIRELLEKIAQKARIPLINGVFKAAVDNFFINAVVSEIVSTRFTIKKQTPYSLLNPQNI